jgi:hypothetical protein
MQCLETDPGAKAKLKAANAIPVNGQISNGRLRDVRYVRAQLARGVQRYLCERCASPLRSASSTFAWRWDPVEISAAGPEVFKFAIEAIPTLKFLRSPRRFTLRADQA